MAKGIPQGMHSVTVQLAMDGASEALAFYEKAFGAEVLDKAPDPSGRKIWHSLVRIGDATLFVNDTFPEMGAGAATARLWIYTSGVDAAFQRAVDAGGKVTMPLVDMFWGDRMGAIQDKWGNTWTIAERVKEMTPQEMREAGEAAAREWQAQSKKG